MVQNIFSFSGAFLAIIACCLRRGQFRGRLDQTVDYAKKDEGRQPLSCSAFSMDGSVLKSFSRDASDIISREL